MLIVYRISTELLLTLYHPIEPPNASLSHQFKVSLCFLGNLSIQGLRLAPSQRELYDPQLETTSSTYACTIIMHEVWACVQYRLPDLPRQVHLRVLAVYFERITPNPAWLHEQEDLKQSLDELSGAT